MTSPRKQRLLDFYGAFYNERRFEEAAERFVAPGFVNHRPGASGTGPTAMARDFAAAAAHMPDFHIEAKRLAEDGDLVWVHALISGLPGGARAVTVDIWRFDGEMLVDHWDVGQRLDPAQDASVSI